MYQILQWTFIILNPILLGAILPIPIIQFAAWTWIDVLLAYVLYGVVWMFIWEFIFDRGRKLTLGE